MAESERSPSHSALHEAEAARPQAHPSLPRAEDRPKSPQHVPKVNDFARLPSVKVHVQSPQDRTQDLLFSQGRGCIALQKPSGVTKNCVNYEGTDNRKDPVSHVMIKDFDQMVFKRLSVARRSLREIAMMAHFRNHPNVVGLLDFVCLPQQHSLVVITERLDYDLRDVFQSTYVFGEQQITCLMYQLLFALLYIHRAEVVHGDIKPVNIQLSTSCDLKLGGFDSAHGDSYFEEPSEYVTTRMWKAPEQVLCEEELSFAVDIWAVGCILAQIYNRSTAGLRPQYKPLFSGTTHSDQLEQIVDLRGTPGADQLAFITNVEAKEYIQKNLSGRPGKDLSMVLHSPDGTTIPKEVVELLDEMLQFDPEKRPSVEKVMQHPFFSEHYDPEDLKIPRDKFRELDDLEQAALVRAQAAQVEPHRRNAAGAYSSATTAEEVEPAAFRRRLRSPPSTFPIGFAKKAAPVSLESQHIDLFISSFTDELRRGLDLVPPESSAAEPSSGGDSPTANADYADDSESISGETDPHSSISEEGMTVAEASDSDTESFTEDDASTFDQAPVTFQLGPVKSTFVGKNVIYELTAVHIQKFDLDRKEFRRLLNVLQRTCGHPGFVSVLDVRDGAKKDAFEVITVHEPTAQRLSETRQCFQLSKAQFLALLESLAFLEKAGLYIGKVDPTSVFVDDKGRVQLDVCSAFFGPAATLGAIYEAPEQIWGGEPCPKSDIWALGCLMAEAFTGQPLFPVVMEAGYMAKVSSWEKLCKILRTLGCPSQEDQREISDEAVLAMIRDAQQQVSKGSSWAALEDRGVPEPAMDLLRSMLGFSPGKRLTAQNALAHPFFEGVDSCGLAEAVPLPGFDMAPSENTQNSEAPPLEIKGCIAMLHSLLCGQEHCQPLLKELNQLIQDSNPDVLVASVMNRSEYCRESALTVSPAVNRCQVGKAFLVQSGPHHASDVLHKAQLVPSELPEGDFLAWVEKLGAVREHSRFVVLEDIIRDPESQRVVLLLNPRMIDLSTVFSQQQPARKFPPQDKIAVAYQLLSALHFLHEAGYCHGHLTPLSVTLNGPQDIIQIEDFGAPVSAADALPNWSAPEVLRGGMPTPAADMWSCGTIIAQMLNQSPPQPDQNEPSDENIVYLPLFSGPKPEDVLQQIRGRPDPVAELSRGRFPGENELLPLLRSILCTEPAERFSAEAAMDSPLFELQRTQEFAVPSVLSSIWRLVTTNHLHNDVSDMVRPE